MDLTFVMSETPARWKTISTFLVIFFNFVKFERLDFIKLIFLKFWSFNIQYCNFKFLF